MTTTVKKWDEMTARDRDALVAEKVMGWHELEKVRPLFTTDWTFEGSDGNVIVEVPHYTTDISAAWEVVEKMKPTHWMEARVGRLAESARFARHHGSLKYYLAQCKTLPESICLAALRALEVDV